MSVEPPPPEPAPIDVVPDIPEFEYELVENMMMSPGSSVESVNSVGIPRFEDGRHPNVKLFVVIFALLGNIFMIYQSIRDIPRQYRSIICDAFGFSDCLDSLEMQIPIVEYCDLCLRVSMEFMFPVGVLIVFSITQILITVSPGMASRIRNPIPSLASFIYMSFFFKCITNLLTSIAMLPYLGCTDQPSFWGEYLAAGLLGLFWMYSLLNMGVFTRITYHNFIRARENYERQVVRNGMVVELEV